VAFPLRIASQFRARRIRDRSGSAAVEFALIGPLLMLMLMGVFTYGGYFLTAQTIQQFANDAARAAIAGLDDQERLAIAEQSLRASLSTQSHMRGDLAGVDVRRDGEVLTVNVSYDASEEIYWAVQTLVPTPSPVIRRTAAIRLGGL
jgi:Flp pilus assembly protein TadG